MRPHATTENGSGKGLELVPFHKNPWIQAYNPPKRISQDRGKEIWRRRGIPGSSKQGENPGKKAQGKGENVTGKILQIQEFGSEPYKSIHVQAVGNGWLFRSAIGKMRRLLSAQEMQEQFKRENIDNVQIRPIGGRYLILTFPNEESRNEVIKKKWLMGWFEEINPWNGEQAVQERFVWVACYGMPLNAWNVPSFKAIASNWGHFIEVDDRTLRELSFEKGRVLLATDNPNKIVGIIQLIVDGSKYNVRVEEESSFRVVTSSSQFSSFGSKVIGEEEDDVDRSKDDKENKRTRGKKQVDDMGKQKDVEASVVADVGAFNAANTSHDVFPLDDVPHQARAGLEFKFGMAADALNAIGVKVQHSLVPKSADLTLQKETEDSNDHISNSSQGLVSFVQDSRSPPQEECQGAESTNIEAKIGEAQEEVEKVELLAQQQETIQNVRLSNGPVVIEPNGNFRFSQLAGIELEVDLNPRNIRKSIRSQAYEECMSSNEATYDDEECINATQEQQLDVVEQELQETILAANILGIAYGDMDVRGMRRMIETEAKGLQQLQRNNRSAPLQKI